MIVKPYVWLKTNPNIMNGQHFWLSSSELCVCAKKRNTIFNGNCEKSYSISTAPQDRHHPNQKPLDIMQNLIMKSTNEGDTILDPFAGSGTTGVACKNLARNFILIEKEPEYIEIIKKRLEQQTLL